VNKGKFDRKFAKILKNLKDNRENGDYEVFSVIDKEIAEETLEEAMEFLEGAEAYLRRYITVASVRRRRGTASFFIEGLTGKTVFYFYIM
jgi:hypothetical protein